MKSFLLLGSIVLLALLPTVADGAILGLTQESIQKEVELYGQEHPEVFTNPDVRNSFIKVIKDEVNNVFAGANAGDIESQENLGVLYYEGRFVEKDLNLAYYWWEKAAANGSTYCQKRLAHDCMDGGVGLVGDAAQCITWINQAANHGDVNSQNYLKKMREVTSAVRADVLAAGGGDIKDFFDSLDLAANMDGGRPFVSEENFNKIKELANNGDTDAQYEVGRCYFAGLGVPQDYEAAITWWELAYEYNSNAALGLAACYGTGRGVKKDHFVALLWLEKAAALGNQDAQRTMDMVSSVKKANKLKAAKERGKP